MVNQNIAFRTDASLDIGTGHVMRCLTLAEALRKRGASCSFICREHAGNLLDLIRQRGFDTYALPIKDISLAKPAKQKVIDEKINAHTAWLGADWQADAEQTISAIDELIVDWLIVDHYSLDAYWELALRPQCHKLMVIDDLADRTHDCDVLLDQNIGRAIKDYENLVPAQCKLLVGPQYALLRPEFSALRQYSLDRRATPQLKNLLITMGGVDKDNTASQVLAVLNTCSLPTGCRITVVMGSHAPWLKQIRDQATQMPWTTEVLVNVNNMAQLMADSDLAIGASGFACYELASLGCIMMLIPATPIQWKVADELLNHGLAFVADKKYKKNIEKIINNFNQEFLIGKNCNSFASSIGGKFEYILNILTLSEIVNSNMNCLYSPLQK